MQSNASHLKAAYHPTLLHIHRSLSSPLCDEIHFAIAPHFTGPQIPTQCDVAQKQFLQYHRNHSSVLEIYPDFGCNSFNQKSGGKSCALNLEEGVEGGFA